MLTAAIHNIRNLIGLVFLISGAVIGHLNAQFDSLFQLQEIEVTARRIDISDIGKHSDLIDSQTLALKHYDHLASLISSQTPLFVRSYGGGTLATLGIRGGGAAHTQVIWNGIPLRNPMLGLIDLALLPAAFIDEASIHYGGHGAAFGSGAVGGLISISNEKISVADHFDMSITAGSWGIRAAQIRIAYGNKKQRFSSRLFSQSADNNYRYRISKDQPERNQVHHRLQNIGFLQEMQLSFDENNALSFRLWIQNANRQIPPTSTQSTSKAAQQDYNLKSMLQWNHTGRKMNWQVKAAWFDETIDYQDTLIALYTNNNFTTWLAEAESAIRISPQLHFKGGISAQHDEAQSANYEVGTSGNQHAVFSSLRFIAKDWVFRFQLREEITQGNWSPLLLDFSTEWAFVRGLSIKANVSRNYRYPTLNDLYWRPGGNPGLIPEEGWTYEAGLHYLRPGKEYRLSSSVTAYTRNIDDWIMWMPPFAGKNYWAPINITEVDSRGFEMRAHLEKESGDLKLRLNGGLDLTWSTFVTPLEEFGIAAGDQLFYVPISAGMGGWSFTYRQFSIFYDHHWFGPSTGINDSLSVVNIGSGGLKFGFGKNKVKSEAILQVDNAWNVPYRIIERRPMAGRTITGTLRFSFSGKGD